MARMTKGERCACNPGWMILSAIVIAIGAFLAIQGFVMQLSLQGVWDMSSVAWILGYYFVGVLLVGAGKILKWRAGCMCPAHGMMSK